MSQNILESPLPQPVNTCDFCKEFSGNRDNAFHRCYGAELQDRTILATTSFRVIPSLGQLVEGHLLLVPELHYRALADMPFDLIIECCQLIDSVRHALDQAYGPCVLFEHGTRTHLGGGCGIEHAHLHAVPLDESADPFRCLVRQFPCKRTSGLEGIKSDISPESSYLYCENARSDRAVFAVDYLPSQYMRRVLAETLGTSEWDWRACQREEKLISAVERLSAILRR